MGLVCIQNSSLLVYSKSQKVSASYCLAFQHSRGKNQPVGGFRPPPPPACLGLNCACVPFFVLLKLVFIISDTCSLEGRELFTKNVRFVPCSLKQRELLTENVPFCVPCSLKEENSSLEKLPFTVPSSPDQNELVNKIVPCSLNCSPKQREQFSRIIPFNPEYL